MLYEIPDSEFFQELSDEDLLQELKERNLKYGCAGLPLLKNMRRFMDLLSSGEIDNAFEEFNHIIEASNLNGVDITSEYRIEIDKLKKLIKQNE